MNKFRENSLLPTCVLNGLHVSEPPDFLINLNDFEKALIQRAKAFQVVTSMAPVGKKNLPNRQLIKKVKGGTFHLPLPLVETLKTLPRPQDPVNPNPEFFILVRGVPTKRNIIWGNFVDVIKLFNALEYLKKTNPLYESILLPQNPQDLLNGLDHEFQYQMQASNRFLV